MIKNYCKKPLFSLRLCVKNDFEKVLLILNGELSILLSKELKKRQKEKKERKPFFLPHKNLYQNLSVFTVKIWSKRGLCLLRMPSRQIPNLTQSCRHYRKVQIVQAVGNINDLRCEQITLRISIQDVGLSDLDSIKAVIAELICQCRSVAAVLVG